MKSTLRAGASLVRRVRVCSLHSPHTGNNGAAFIATSRLPPPTSAYSVVRNRGVRSARRIVSSIL